uniref:3'(2'),5'-bisphosphate nucleotidase n=1 Tax=Alexandrium monilatum TaxID=311494 RepID=A0A7S4PT58_9DINO
MCPSGATCGARFCESYESGHSSHEDSALVAQELGITRSPLRMDSQVKYGILSRDEAQVFLRMPGGLTGGTYRENIWDHASGTLLLREAGGDVCDIFGKPLDFSRGYKLFENKGVMATTSPELLRMVVSAVGAVRANQSS